MEHSINIGIIKIKIKFVSVKEMKSLVSGTNYGVFMAPENIIYIREDLSIKDQYVALLHEAIEAIKYLHSLKLPHNIIELLSNLLGNLLWTQDLKQIIINQLKSLDGNPGKITTIPNK